jgi:predicted RecB family nuclease
MRKTLNGLSFDSRDLMRSQCPHCTKVSVARELKVPGLQELIDQFYVKPDSLAIRYGMRFEAMLEQELVRNLGDLVQAPQPQTLEATLELMKQGVPVIYQGVLKGGSGELEFSGKPDFLLRGDYRFQMGDAGLTAIQVGSWQGGYTAWDAKLSSSPKPDYQIQVGLYADVLRTLGLEAPADHGLILGSREIAAFSADAVIAQMIAKRASYQLSVAKFLEDNPQRLEDIGELVCDASSYCDMCEYPALCRHMRLETNNLQLVAGITKSQIEALRQLGVTTIRQLAALDEPTSKHSVEVIRRLALQARLQQNFFDTGNRSQVVTDPELLAELPKANPGDLFFDLEGFTFFGEPGGLEYLWGWMDASGEFFHHWADDRAGEELAYEAFMQALLTNRKRYPESRVYHYAQYEKTALKKLAARTGKYEYEVAQLIETGVFVDLYRVVEKTLVISEERYSIKNLENFYEFDRSSDVKEAMGSMEFYDKYLSTLAEDETAAEKLKRQVIAYNRDDCASTLALYRWLLDLT